MELPKVLQNPWWIVFAASVGLAVGIGPMVPISFAVFVKPVTEDLGWSRTQFSFALLVMGCVTVLMQPIVGGLIDRYGVKRVSLPMVPIMSLGLMGMALMGPSIIFLYVLYGVAAVGGAAQAPPMYSKAVAMWFDQKRGLALGLATMGSSVGTMLIPLEATYLIQHYGWRWAYAGLGVTNIVIASLVIAIFIREPPGYHLKAAKGSIDPKRIEPAGVSVKEAITSRRFWMLTAAVGLAGLVMHGTLTHVVALLGDRGWTASSAVGVLAASGLAGIAGRVIGGLVLDRSRGSAGPGLLMLLPAAGCLLLATTSAPAPVFIGAMLIGFGNGAEIDMIGYFCSRYFGLRSYGQILGICFSGFAIGGGIGPVMLGLSHDLTQSYQTALIINCGVMILVTVLFATLGTYTYMPTKEGPATDPAPPKGGAARMAAGAVS